MYLPAGSVLINDTMPRLAIRSSGVRLTENRIARTGWQLKIKCAPQPFISQSQVLTTEDGTGLILKTLMHRILHRSSSPQRDRPDQTISATEIMQARIPDATRDQIEIVESVSDFTMTSPERILALCGAVEYLASNNIRGDFVECGVWRGGSMAAAARTLVNSGMTDRTLWMYDTYDGMSEPTERDIDLRGQSAEQLMSEQDRADAKSVWCCSPLEQVKTTMFQTGYPIKKINFIEGKVEDTLPNVIPDQIALLRLDTDWYESTRCELEFLFPRLVPGGVLIVDDYGHWEGCRRAVDEYFQQNRISMLLNRIDYTGRIGIHCPVSNST